MKKLLLVVLALVAGSWGLQAQTTILAEDFESGTPPTGWTTSANTPSVGWEFGTSLGSQFFPVDPHTRYACSNDDAHDDNSAMQNVADMDYLISPAMDLTPHSGSGVVMTFEYVQPGNWGSTGAVEVSTDGGTTWSAIQTVPTTASWATGTVDLTSYTNQSALHVAFRHNDGGGWADGMAVDDVEVRTVAANDAALDAITVDAYVASGNVDITGDYSNQGSNAITSLDINYQIDNGAVVTDNLTGLNVPLLGTGSFTHSTPANLSTPGTYTLKVWTSNPSGNMDNNAGNDTMMTTISVLSQIPSKRAILEDHTGAWCQFCPDGTVIAEQVISTYSDAIVIAVHNNDAMDIPEGNQISAEYITGYPGGTIDHFKFEGESAVELNRGNWSSRMGDRLAMTSPAAVSIESQSWNSATREITVTVKADFYGTVSGDLRLNAYVVEDSVVGQGQGYDQINFYNTQSGHPFSGAGNPIVGFVHDHTLRAMLGGAWGSTNSGIPTTVNDGDSYTETFTHTLDAGHREGFIKLVAVLQQYDNDADNRPIWNSEQEDLEILASVDGQLEDAISSIYPNPFSDEAHIEFSLDQGAELNVEIFDLFGKRISTLASGFHAAGAHKLTWNGNNQVGSPAADGVYMVVITSNGQKTIEKVVLAR